MTDYTELKRLAEASLGEWYEFGELRCEDRSGYINGLHHDDEYFIAAANPSAVLALIAENDSQCKDLQNLRTDNAQLIYALKQEEQSYLMLRAERDQLRAEVAGLRTGYEAYEQVNAELKAKNEAMRKDWTDWQAECLKRGFEYVRESDDHYVLADVPEMADLLGSMLGVEVRSKENDAYEEANSQLNEQIEGLINTIHAQESMRKDAERLQIATALVQKLCDAAGNQPSVATGYLHDILDAMGKGEQS